MHCACRTTLALAALLALAPCPARAQEVPPLKAEPTQAPLPQSRVWALEPSYLVPALEIPGFILLLNQYDRRAYPTLVEEGKKTYGTTLQSFKDHVFHGPWGIDQDAFAMNQFNHPYSGTIYHGFARSAGLGFWTSLLYTNAGSLAWETGGETTRPSYNDQIASGVAGSFFGEALFRMAGLVMEGDGIHPPTLWRKLGAAMLAPSAAINRYAFGDRFRAVFPSGDPALTWRVRLGESLHSDLEQQGVRSTIARNQVTADFSLAYGLPGKDGYTYERPFDYFQFDLTTLGSHVNPVDTILIRGLLLGTKYELGDSYQGIWGLYGGYDYISPQIFRVSSTSVSLGTTFQFLPTEHLAMQGTAMAGVGYAASGNANQGVDRDYHYGIAPQALASLRVIIADTLMFDITGRSYRLSGVGSDDPGGRENINRLNAGLTVRVYHSHGLGIQYVSSSRAAYYPGRADVHQTVGTVALVYNLMGDMGFGVVR